MPPLLYKTLKDTSILVDRIRGFYLLTSKSYEDKEKGTSEISEYNE